MYLVENFKPGDIVKWQGVNKTIYAQVVKDENGELYLLTNEGKSFQIQDLLRSASFTKI